MPIWKTRKKGTKRQVGKKFALQDSNQKQKRSLPSIFNKRLMLVSKHLFAVPCVDSEGRRFTFEVLAVNEEHAIKKAVKRGLTPLPVSNSLEE